MCVSSSNNRQWPVLYIISALLEGRMMVKECLYVISFLHTKVLLFNCSNSKKCQIFKTGLLLELIICRLVTLTESTQIAHILYLTIRKNLRITYRHSDILFQQKVSIGFAVFLFPCHKPIIEGFIWTCVHQQNVTIRRVSL